MKKTFKSSIWQYVITAIIIAIWTGLISELTPFNNDDIKLGFASIITLIAFAIIYPVTLSSKELIEHRFFIMEREIWDKGDYKKEFYVEKEHKIYRYFFNFMFKEKNIRISHCEDCFSSPTFYKSKAEAMESIMKRIRQIIDINKYHSKEHIKNVKAIDEFDTETLIQKVLQEYEQGNK